MKQETQLNNMIKDLFQEIKSMRPEDGFTSPRDLKLVNDINKKKAFMDKLQAAMRLFNQDYKKRD